MERASRLVQVGVAVTGLGSTITAVVLTYTLSNGLSFWSLPVFTSAAVIVVGLVVLGIAVLMPSGPSKDGATRMSQSSGKNSTNIQAGRDIALNGRTDGQE